MVCSGLLLHKLNKFPIFLADFLRFGERTSPFNLQTTEVCLHVADVGLEVLSYKVSILLCGVRIARNERSGRGQTGFRLRN